MGDRQRVWVALIGPDGRELTGDGYKRPPLEVFFQVPGGATVAGYRFYTAREGGQRCGEDYPLPAEPFGSLGGEYYVFFSV